jgi:hypothetical protein
LRITVFILLVFISSLFAEEPQRLEFSRYSDKVSVSKISYEEADSLFQFIMYELTFIEFEDCNNCESRAHLISAILEKQFPNVHVAKAWLFADFKRASQAEKYRYKPDAYLKYGEECNNWGFHVAPVVIIARKQGADTIILDPSTQSSPVTLRQWAMKLVPEKAKGFLIVKERKYYTFPDDSQKKFEDMKEEWKDDQNKDLYDDDYMRSIENILTVRFGIWEEWTLRNYIAEIKDMLN